MELNHKLYRIYGAENKPVRIENPKEVQILRNNEPTGTTLNHVFREIEDLSMNKIYGWSILECYKVEEGYLVDAEGNKISLMQGEDKIFFKLIEDPLIIYNEKEVSIDYIRDVSSLLGMGAIEETITGLSNEDKQVFVSERMQANEKRQREIQRERAEADTREKQKLEAEQKRIAAEQKEEEIRLAKLEEEKKYEEEEGERERMKIAAEKRQKEREENENVYSPSDYRALRKEYLGNGFTEYITQDGKYIFFFPEEITEEEAPFIVLKTDKDYEELVGGELTINTDKAAEYEFKHGNEEKVVTLNKKTDTIRVQVLA